MDVGVRELKARLSEYLDRAAAGEVIRVTDRGVPRAVLMPLPREHRVEQGLQEGWISRTSSRRRRPVEPVAAPSGRRSEVVLDEDRGE